jgi:hypothetical protein
VISAPTPADIGGFPRKNMRFETLPRIAILNSEESRRDFLYQPYKTIIAE